MISANFLQKSNVQPAIFILLFGLFLVFTPHFSHLPLWLSIVISGLLIWRGAYELKFCARPNKFILFILTLMLLIGILFSYHTIVGRNAGSAMLLGLLALKLFEVKSFRDISIIINLAIFSIVINFLFSQSIFVAFIMLFALALLFTALISFQHDYKNLIKADELSLKIISRHEKQHFNLAVKMLTQAIPFAIVLFVLFPRVNGPLWGLPEDAFSGTTGLSDKMSPGKISRLSNNSSVAFRVNFDSAVPASNKLYWRGPVMWDFNGYDWTAPNSERVAEKQFEFVGSGIKVNYSVTLQPHNSYWMFALDIPANIPTNAQLSVDMQILSSLPIQKLHRYNISSYTNYVLPASKHITMTRYLKLPDMHINEPGTNLYQSRKLINKLKDLNNPQNTIKNVLNYFATENFYYSRKAPLLYNNPIDEFLFDSKRGYCEHYASSFTVLMRLAGIPARIVTGYQGGEINPIDNYMTIRQSDAHAWTEVYLGDKGWTRVDPTAAIPPSNIENNDDARRLNSNLKKPSQIFKSNWFLKQAKQMRYAWDAINNRWNQWVLGYDNKKQKALFAALGIPEISWQGLSQLLFGILTLLTGLLAFIVFSNKVEPKDEIENHYFKFLRKMKKFNLTKSFSEGANDFCSRATAFAPTRKKQIEEITLLYQQLRYQGFNEKKLALFKTKIHFFDKGT